MLFKETVEAGTLDLIKRLMQDEHLANFHLVGGTALSLHIGHRISIDIDLFSNTDFDAQSLSRHIQENYKAEKLRTLTNGVFGLIENIKTDLIAHQYKWLNPIETIEGIRIVSLRDIAAMKVHAIVQSGNRLKDFVDIYALLEKVSLKEIGQAYVSKYPEATESIAYSALMYHSDIDFSVPIKLTHGRIEWEKIADRLKESTLNKEKVFQPQVPKQRRGRGL